MARCFHALFAGLLLVGCGGSSSETPFPLEPDRATLRGDGGPPAGSRYVALPGAEERGEDGADSDDSLLVEEEPGVAPSTWGGPVRRRR